MNSYFTSFILFATLGLVLWHTAQSRVDMVWADVLVMGTIYVCGLLVHIVSFNRKGNGNEN
jgi:hypothetical protein